MDWVSSNVETIFLSILLPLALFFFALRRKSLEYAAYVPNAVITAPSGYSDVVQILVDGQEASSLRTIKLGLGNMGNVPVRKDDFEGPLTFRLGGKCRVLRHAAAEGSPASLQPSYTVENDPVHGAIIVIEPLLLNSRDIVGVDLLIDGSPEISCEGRVAGVSEIKRGAIYRGDNGRIRAASIAMGGVAIGLSAHYSIGIMTDAGLAPLAAAAIHSVIFSLAIVCVLWWPERR